jgi:gliding motility-associated-like protein
VVLCAGAVHVLPNGLPVSTSGTYTSDLTSTLTGCDSVITTTLIGAPAPAVDFYWTPIPVDALDPEVSFVNTTTGAAECAWTIGQVGESEEWSPEFRFEEMVTGEHLICLECMSDLGCPSTACAVLVIEGEVSFFVPTAFTPDGDGVNEVLAPVLVGGQAAGYRFTVVDRWGTTVFETEDPEDFWNGNVQGGEYFAPDGVYQWRAIVPSAYGPDRLEFTGTVVLMR